MFHPQYYIWSREDFESAEDATIVNSGEYEIVGGVAKLIPQTFSGQTFNFGNPWSPVNNWTVTSTLDSLSVLSGDGFKTYVNTVSGLTGTIENINTFYQTAMSTNTPGPTGSVGGVYSTASAAIVYNLNTGIWSGDLTTEFKVRTIKDSVSREFDFIQNSGVVAHGVYIGYQDKAAFVEIHPDGIKVHKGSGAFLVEDFSSNLRSVRLTCTRSGQLDLITDLGTSLSVTGAFKNLTGSVPYTYIAYGAPKLNNSSWGTGVSEKFHNAPYFHTLGLTGIAAFEGQTLWDDIKINTSGAVINWANGFPNVWPTGTKTIYTAPWYPDPSVTNVISAIIETRPIPGGTLVITPQHAEYSGQSTELSWSSINLAAVTLDGTNPSTKVMHLGRADIFQGIYPAIRFKLEATSTSGAVTEVDTITCLANPNFETATFSPNWKLTSLPKDIYITVNEENWKANPPKRHYEDLVFFENITGNPYLPPGLLLGQYSDILSVVGPGEVVANTSTEVASGFVSIDDGVYGKAWRSFSKTGEYSGIWYSETYRPIDYDSTFIGNLIDIYRPYPASGYLPPATTGVASVVYNVDSYLDFNNNIKLVQRTTVDSYTGSHNTPIGFELTGIYLSTGAGARIGFIQGSIQIPKGPGVLVTMHEALSGSSYFLNGDDYREQKDFGCTMQYTGTGIGDIPVSFSFGVLPRTGKPETLNESIYGSWLDNIEPHKQSEFILYNVSGYIIDWSSIRWRKAENTFARNNIKLPYDREVGPSGETYGELKALGIDYEGIRRESLLMEGWIRPFGYANPSTLAEPVMDWIVGAAPIITIGEISINRSGEVIGKFNASIHTGAWGYEGFTAQDMFISTTGPSLMDIKNGSTPQLYSNGHTISWGSWNHVGLYLESKAFGDTETASNLVPVPGYSGFPLHAARSTRAYLEVNGNICDSIDLSPNEYAITGWQTGSVTAGFPGTKQTAQIWPKLAKSKLSTGTRNFRLGNNMICDYDHVRLSVRHAVDTASQVPVLGNRDFAPIFAPYDALKPISPILSGLGHIQLAHIYRFDYPTTNYQGWDVGFSPNHALLKNRVHVSELANYGIKSFNAFTDIVTGPKGRNALRLGPGQNILIPWSSFDEKLFNGTGSFQLSEGVTVSGQYETQTGFNVTGLVNWARDSRYIYNRSTSNSHVVFGGTFALNSFPTGSLQTADLLVFSETTDPNEDTEPTISTYGLGQIYLGVNNSGEVKFGTRADYIEDGLLNNKCVGPFTGSALESGVYTTLVLDSKLGLGSGYMDLYINNVLDTHISLSLTRTGAVSRLTGRPPGYLGRLGPVTSSQSKSRYILGGAIPKTITNPSWLFPYTDVSVSEVFIGYKIDGLDTTQNPADINNWNYTGLPMSGEPYSGHTDVSIKDIELKINQVIGTGENPFYLGRTTYPATDYESAGEQLFWSTIMYGNDYEGLLFAGLPLFSQALFMNAASYYAIYENNNAAQVFGTTDSPIQLGTTVPEEGINLALISNGEWNTDQILTTFDLSDHNYDNITNKVQGNFTINNLSGASLGYSGLTALSEVDSEDIRISSIAVYNDTSTNQNIGFFMHLLGSETKGLYLPNAYSHLSVSGDYDLYHNNLRNIRDSIKITDVNGNIIPYDLFPYTVLASPYSPSVYPDLGNTGDVSILGYGNSLVTNLLNEDGVFSVLLISQEQTIGQTVFINYPSRTYKTKVTNLQDSEIYNPIPVLKRTNKDNIVSTSGSFIAEKGTYSIGLDVQSKDYNVDIWYGHLS